MSKIVIIKKRQNAGSTNINKWISFVKFEISKTKFDNNIFSIRYKQSKATVITNFTMPSEFKDCISSVISNDEIPINDLDADDEFLLYEIVKRAGLYDTLKIGKKPLKKLKSLTDELEMLEGNIRSGNNNKDVMIRYKHLLMNLYRMKKIPYAEFQYKCTLS